MTYRTESARPALGPSSGRRSDPASWSPGKRRRYAWLITGLLFFLMTLNWADKAVLGLAAVPIMRDLNISPEAFGLLGSAMFFTFSLAQFAAAPIIDRVPTKWAMLVLCLLWSVAQVPILVSASLPALWIGRLLLGAGEGPLAPVLLHGIYKWFPEKKRATPAALACSGTTLGIVIFAPMLAWVIGQYGWLAAFASLAVAGVIWSAVWLFAGKEGPYISRDAEASLDGGSDPEETQEPADTRTDAAARIPYLRTILTPTWIFSVLAAFFAYWTFTLAMAWGPAYFETVLHVPSQQAGSLIALPAAWGAISTVGLSALTQRLHISGVPTRKSRAWVLGIGTMVSGGTLLGAVFAQNPVLSIGLMVVGFGTAPALFVITPLIVSELTSAAQRGANLSIAIGVFTAGGLFAPAISGFIIGGSPSAAAGYSAAFAVSGALTLGAGILCFLFANQQRERQRLGITEEAPATVPAHG